MRVGPIGPEQRLTSTRRRVSVFRPPSNLRRVVIALMVVPTVALFVPASKAAPSYGTSTTPPNHGAAFNVEDWPPGITSFVRIQEAGMPIFRKSQYTSEGTNLIRLTHAGEIVPYRDKTMTLVFGNPFERTRNGNGTWYKISLLNGTEGWIFPATEYPVLEFKAARMDLTMIGTGGKRLERKVFRFAKRTFLGGSRGETVLASREGGYGYVYGEDAQSVTLGNLKGSLGTWAKSDLSGWTETIPWYTEWDTLRRRPLPPLLWVLSPIGFLLLSLATIYHDPEHKKRTGIKVVALVWFSIVSISVILLLGGKRVDYSLETSLELHRYDVLAQFVLLFLLLPYLAVVAFFYEGFLTCVLRIRHFSSQISMGEIMKKRATEKEYQAKEEQLAEEEEAITAQEARVNGRLSALGRSIPEILRVEPGPVMDYDGLWGEVEKRFQQRQMLKTAKVARERLEEVRMLCEEGARLQRARADLEIAKVEWESVHDEIRIKKKERILKEKLVDRDILQTDHEMELLKGGFHQKQREDFEL